MKKCPHCNSSRWDGRFCRKCRFTNDPSYINKKFSEEMKGGNTNGNNKNRQDNCQG